MQLGAEVTLRKTLRFAVAIALATSTAPSFACDIGMAIFQLPGETEAEAKERTTTIINEHFITQRYEREQWDIQHAKRIYIARVTSNNRAEGIKARPQSSVQPIVPIKGTLPADLQELREVMDNSCSNWGDGNGDGQGTAAAVGTLVVVFEGLPKSVGKPRGIDSLEATSIRDAELLDKLTEHAKIIGEI